MIVLLASGLLLAFHLFGHGQAGPRLADHTVPAQAQPISSAATTAPAPAAPTTAVSPSPTPTPQPGLPARIVVPTHHLDTVVTANPLLADGQVYVPRDPRTVSWASGTGSQGYAAPGSPAGTIILVAHINFAGVTGAFGDLASYRAGQRIAIVLTDGRQLGYTVVGAPISVSKEKLAADLTVPGTPLHHQIFDQTGVYGAPDGQHGARLLLASCGGSYDNETGNYEDNIFVFALPTGPVAG